MSQLPKQIIDLLKRCLGFTLAVERELDVKIQDTAAIERLLDEANKLGDDIDNILEPPDQN